jgi:hypothetical protein
MQRANIALALAATLAAGCNELQEVLGDIGQESHGHGHGTGQGGGSGGPVTPPPASSCGPALNADDLYRTIAADLSRLDADDQPFQRYVTLANLFNAGQCGSDLDEERAAVGELFNVTSIESTLSRPVAIDADELTFRVDLRDYAWDREIVVDGRSFSDGWEAALASSPYAIEFGGPDADDAKADTGTRVPLLNFDALADVASQSSLYYALIDVPSSSEELLDSLAIAVDQNRRDGEAVLAGTTRSRISRADRIVERHDLEVRAGFFWRALDFFDDAGSIFEDPLSQQNDGSVALFTLPNGLLGFSIFDGDGARRDDSDILLDTNQNNFRATVALSCLNCHGPTGIIPIEDEVRAVVQNNADQLDPALVAGVERLYPPQAELEAILERDAEQYASARASAGLSGEGADPLAIALLGFDQDLGRAIIAADLWVPESAVVDNASELPPLFSAPLLDRDDFSSAYAEAICIVTETENSPVDCL